MKKLSVLLCIIMLLLFPFSASAAKEEATFANAAQLFEHWNGCYPDYISGVWSTDGSMNNLAFGITADADFESVKNEILSLVENDSSITFVQQKYSYSALKQIQAELDVYFLNYDPALGLCSMGIYETENFVQIEFLEDKKEDEAVKEFIAHLQQKYGDAVKISYTSGYATFTVDTNANTATLSPKPFVAQSPVIWWVLGICGILLCVICVGFYSKKRKSVLLQTATGENITVKVPFTTKQAQQAVRSAMLTPSEETDQKIQQQ